MNRLRLLRKWFGGSAPVSSRRSVRQRYHPELETLEARVVPQATRTWVSGVGDDANPFSRTAPGKTFAGAISKTAVGGEIDALDPGGFGAVTITHSISIEAIGVVAGVLVSGVDGIVINAGPSDVVVLNGLTIDGNSESGEGLDGIHIYGAGAVFVENCTIKNFADYGIEYTNTATGKLFIFNTTISNNAKGAILLDPAAAGVAAALNNVTLEGNQLGLQADDGSRVALSHSTVAGNTGQGVLASSTSLPVAISLNDDVVSLNGFNRVAQGAGASISDAATAPTPFAIAGLSPANASATVGKAYTPALQVEVVDAFGDPVAGASVTFKAPASGARGTFGVSAMATAKTNASGVATAPAFKAGTIAGSFTVAASVTGVTNPVTFKLQNVAGPAAKVVAQAVNPPHAKVNQTYASLLAQVTDSFGNPVDNANVTFTAPGTGPSGTFLGLSSVIVMPFGNGIAQAPSFKANTKAGSFTVSATIPGGAKATFSLTNLPGAPALAVIVAGSNQHAAPNATFATALKVKILDSFGNPVAQSQVTFTVQPNGGTGSAGAFNGNASVQVNTGATGQAIAPSLKANSKPGQFTVGVSDGLAVATFDLTIT
jgi:hypothetical protein